MSSFINREIERGLLAHAILLDDVDGLAELNTCDFGDKGTQNIFKAIMSLKDEFKPISEQYLNGVAEKFDIDEVDLLETFAASPLAPSIGYIEMLKENAHKRNISEVIRQAMYKMQRSGSEETIAEIKDRLDILKEQIQSKDVDFEIVGIDEIDEEPITFVGQNYLPLPRNSAVLLAGRGGVGKSGIALQAAIKHILSTGEKAFCWLSEDPLGETKQRAEKICRQLGITLSQLHGKLGISNRKTFNVALKDRDNIVTNPEFIKLQEATKEYDLIVLDPLRSFASNFDENSNSDMDNVTKEFAQWAKKEKKVIILIHHASKDGDIRGASSIVDASRLAYIVENGVSESTRNVEIRKDNFGVKKLINGNKITVTAIKE